MADTTLTTVVNQIQEFWSPVFAEELRTSLIMPMILDATDKLKPGSIIQQGNKVKVSQINEMTGVNQAAGVCTYVTEELSLQDVDITVDQRAYAALSFCDVVELQSQINLQRADVRAAMQRAVKDQINTYLYGLVDLASKVVSATLDHTHLLDAQEAADAAGWADDDRWLVVDPFYYKTLLADSVLTSADFCATDCPVIGGQLVMERFGWKIIKDNSLTMKTAISGGAPGAAVFMTSNWAHYIPQRDMRFMASDAHSNNEFVVKATIDTVYGAGLGNQGVERHFTYASA